MGGRTSRSRVRKGVLLSSRCTRLRVLELSCLQGRCARSMKSLVAAPYEEEILVTDAKYAELRLIAAGFEPEERAWWFEALRDATFESP